MARKKEIDRDRILDAAAEVILASGGRQFTLDAVAERAGISKGGLVYTFATKDSLIAAALEREMARFQTAVDGRVDGDSASPEQRLLAHVEEALAEDDALTRTAAFLVTALVHAPEMIGPARRFYNALSALFDPDTEQGRDVRQAVLALEGLFLLRGLGLVDVSIDEWTSVLNHARCTILKAGKQR